MVLTDISQIPGRFEARIALLTGLGNGKSPSPRAKGAGGVGEHRIDLRVHENNLGTLAFVRNARTAACAAGAKPVNYQIEPKDSRKSEIEVKELLKLKPFDEAGGRTL